MSQSPESHSQAEVQQLFTPKYSEEDRNKVVRELLPEGRKEELIKSAEENKLGEHVRYYRWIGPGEATLILSGETVTPLTSPTIRSDFQNNREWLIGSFTRYAKDLSPDFNNVLPEVLEKLGSSPTLEQFMGVSLNTIPRFDLFRLHIRQLQYVNNYYGLMSLSACPIIEPSGFKLVNDKIVGSAIAELVIPNSNVLVNPPTGGLRETEKEINTLEIRPEWLVDLYTSREDFTNRFIAVAGSPLEKEYKALLERACTLVAFPCK